jgi:hypothetical protein
VATGAGVAAGAGVALGGLVAAGAGVAAGAEVLAGARVTVEGLVGREMGGAGLPVLQVGCRLFAFALLEDFLLFAFALLGDFPLFAFVLLERCPLFAFAFALLVVVGCCCFGVGALRSCGVDDGVV